MKTALWTAVVGPCVSGLSLIITPGVTDPLPNKCNWWDNTGMKTVCTVKCPENTQ